MNIDALLVVAFWFSVLVDAFVTGANAGDAIAFHQQFGTGKPGKQIHAALLHLFAEPAYQAAQRQNEIPMVTKWGWGDRQGEVSIPGEVKNAIVIDGTKQRCP